MHPQIRIDLPAVALLRVDFHMVKPSRRQSLNQIRSKKKRGSTEALSKGAIYEIEEHKHRFAAWAASRAASVNGCRFSVEKGKAILEGIGLDPKLSDPKDLPAPDELDAVHRAWRQRAINVGKVYGLFLTHGVSISRHIALHFAHIICTT